MGKSGMSPHTVFGMLNSGEDVSFSARPRWKDNTNIDHVESSCDIVNEVLRNDFRTFGVLNSIQYLGQLS
jgi:hypothetical protein